ncbi:MAG: DNA polymerase-3 subunit delta' [Chitinophagales bacterium]|jgi:DNA polymerase-3 subunit delta'
MQFKQVIAQNELKKQLIQSAKNDKVSQAMLFLGAEGTGKLSMALAFAQYVNCENPQEDDSCGTCSSCVKAHKMAHPDIFYTYPTIGAKTISRDKIKDWRIFLAKEAYFKYPEWIAQLDNENKQGNITAEECNQVIRQHSLRHFEGKYKVQVIWGAEMLRKEGNRLLKLIEEPPANTIFILISQSQEAILPTILSRTQLIKFPKLQLEDIVQALEEQQQIPKDEGLKIAQIADGSWIDAKELLGQTQNDYFEEFREWLLLIIQHNARPSIKFAQGLVNWSDKMGASGRQNQKAFLQYALFFIREGIAAKHNLPSKLQDQEKSVAIKMIDAITWRKMLDISQIINNLHYQIVRNANAKIAFLGTSMKIKALHRQ